MTRDSMAWSDAGALGSRVSVNPADPLTRGWVALRVPAEVLNQDDGLFDGQACG
jgi:hypothetical protein